MATGETLSADEQRLAELGYKQELKRGWSGFSNFAISFSIISILAGCFTTYGQAWNNGGPIAISIGWPLISILVLLVIIVLLVFVPSHHQSFSFVFGHRINNSGFSHNMYWFYILPLGFLLTMYTITGYDASAHISEETHGAAMAAPKGVWRSVFYSALFGWAVLLALTFAATHVGAINTAGGASQSIIETALSSAAAKAVLVIATVGQIFCGMACLTSASRMTFAFSRDGAVPGHNLWRKLGKNRTPTWSVLFVVMFAALITFPAYFPNHLGTPVAFLAVTSISVIGLYIAYT